MALMSFLRSRLCADILTKKFRSSARIKRNVVESFQYEQKIRQYFVNLEPVYATGWRIQESRFDFQQGQVFSLVSTTSRPPLVPTQPPNHRVSWVHCRGGGTAARM